MKIASSEPTAGEVSTPRAFLGRRQDPQADLSTVARNLSESFVARGSRRISCDLRQSSEKVSSAGPLAARRNARRPRPGAALERRTSTGIVRPDSYGGPVPCYSKPPRAVKE